MREYAISMWLPVARANFYSPTVRHWVRCRREADRVLYASGELDRPGYLPRLQASVLRRVLEVLPRSFGYAAEGVVELCAEADERTRPVAVTLTLTVAPQLSSPAGPQRRANAALVAAGVARVRLRVDEHGSYAFVASAPPTADEAAVRAALRAHVGEVFGGAYSLDRRSTVQRRRDRDHEGGAAVKRYNGLATEPGDVDGPPLGILTFFQLNTLVEGLCNESLSPAVFFEQNRFLRQYLLRRDGATSVLHTVAQVVELLTVEADASTAAGQIVALHRFLEVTSREVLQRLKWSVESVRRSLLDEMMSMLHRQSRLIQLDLGAIRGERTPELADGASESQLRGYVMLIAAKLPLVINVHEIALLALDHLDDLVKGESGGRAEVGRLRVQLRHWKALLDGLDKNVRGVEDAIEHAWRERLLYEQQQVRSEQEAMAEIERGRHGRPATDRASRTAYNAVMLVLTAAAVLITVKTTDLRQLGQPSASWWDLVVALWPVGALAVVAYLVVPGFGSLMRMRKERHGVSDSYPYEFAFRLDEPADPAKVYAFLARRKRRSPSTSLPKYTVTNQGGGRIERVSVDTTLIKVHSIAVFRVARGRYARFEVVNEILAHKVSNRTRYVIVQSRVFGDSPRSLRPEEVLELLRVILRDVADQLSSDGSLEVPDLLALADPVFSGRSEPLEPVQDPDGVEESVAA